MRFPWAVGLVLLLLAASCLQASAQPSRTTFKSEHKDGLPVATFSFEARDRAYSGMVFCVKEHRFLTIVDRAGTVPPALRSIFNAPVEFTADGKPINGRATYAPASGVMPAMMFFDIPALDRRSFDGDGLSLRSIANPRPSPVESAGVERAVWTAAVSAFAFTIVATDSEQILTPVFRNCAPR
jgi:hypothetical protein